MAMKQVRLQTMKKGKLNPYNFVQVKVQKECHWCSSNNGLSPQTPNSKCNRSTFDFPLF